MSSLLGPARTSPPDPAEIAGLLTSSGQYVLRVHPQPHQLVVDTHWAAHQAGKLLGIKVRVTVDGPVRNVDPCLTITVTQRPKTAAAAPPA